MSDSVSTLKETGTEIADSAGSAGSLDNPAPVIESDLLEDSLVEEVSIDGMCGVY